MDYSKNLDAFGQPERQWQCSLFVLSTIMSRNVNGRYAIVDAGLKAVSIDSGVPTVRDDPQVRFENGGDEHGKLVYPTARTPGQLNDQVFLLPGHCDPTVNLYDFIVGIRNNVVEHVWTVDARGPGN